MKKKFAFVFLPLLLWALALCTLTAQDTPQNKPATLIVAHVTVIDATGAPAQTDMAVVIAGGRISEISKGSNLHAPSGTKLIDATGKFLIPGLWDMHVHWSDREFLPLFLANGVTGMRIMWGQAGHHDWRRQSEAGQLLAPHMIIASTPIDGPKPYFPNSIGVANPAQARQAVVDAKAGHADFIKVYSFLTRDEYFAIADEAKKQGLPFAGHVPLSVSAEEASNAGQESFEHLLGVLPACSSRSEELAQAARDDLADTIAGKERAIWGRHSEALRQMQLDTYSPEKAAILFATLKRNGTWQCPTLTVLHSIAYLDDPAFTNDSRLKYMPRWTHDAWDPARARKMYGRSSAEDLAFAKKEFRKDLELVGAMQKAGVGILAGTDTSNAFCMPGFSLHDELGFLVRAGLTPMQVLQTATLNPARFLGIEKDFGTIEKGKVADLVLLDANPLNDIANTKRIAAVIYGGKLFARPQLDKMLSDVEIEAARLPISDVLMKTIDGKGVTAAVKQYHDLKSTQPATYDYSSRELIGLGYQLLKAKRVTDAIEVFKLSVEVDPRYYNTWDSLAEAYMDHGDKQLAIQNYKKSLDLNPANLNAVEKLKQLNAPDSAH
jgi:imidazolonepropionase-like amidohydrolase